MDPQKNLNLPPVGELFRQSWNRFTQSILSLFLLNIVGVIIYFFLGVIAVIIFIISGIGSSLLQKGVAGLPGLFSSPSMLTTSIILGVIFILLFSIIGMALQIASILIIDSGGKLELGSNLKKALGLIIPFLLVSILSFILSVGALFLFVLPFILFYLLLVFVQYEVILNNQRFTKAIKRSVLLVTKNFGGILIRLILLALIYLGYSIVTNILSKIGSDVAILISIISFIINLLLGWFTLAYTITLYRQASLGLEKEPGKGILWMWLIALVGWVIAIAIGFGVYKTLSSGILNQMFKKSVSPNVSSNLYSNVPGSISTQSSLDLTKDATAKIEEYMRLNTEGNTTNADKGTKLLTEALAQYNQATTKDPQNLYAWENLAQLYQKLGEAVPKDSVNQKVLFQQSANAYFQLGKAYVVKGSKEEAKKAFENALAIIPTDNQTIKSQIEKALEDL